MSIKSLRTTVTLDRDVLDRTREFSRKRGLAFKQALNDFLRAGLRAEAESRPTTGLKIKTFHMGTAPGIDFSCTSRLLDYLDRSNR